MSNFDLVRHRRPNIQLQLQVQYPTLASLLRRRTRKAIIFILGFPQTGKKTLARRFSTMDQGRFTDEAPSQYEYIARIDLDTRETNGTGDVFLTTFVIPPPRDLPEKHPPHYLSEIYKVSAMIFLLSVVDRRSYADVVNSISSLRGSFYQNGLPYFFVVGNKMDLDRTNYPNHFRYDLALAEVRHRFEVDYLECSARENIKVDVILEKILQRVISDQP